MIGLMSFLKKRTVASNSFGAPPAARLAAPLMTPLAVTSSTLLAALQVISLAVLLTMSVVSAPASAAAPPDRSWPHYFAVKTVMQHLYESDPIQARRLKEVTSKYDLSNCEPGSEYLGDGKPTVTAEFADIAFDVIVWREALTKLGYPATLWQPSLVTYEQQEVDRAIALPTPIYFAFSAKDAPDAGSSTIGTMIGKLNAYRTQHPTLPELITQGGCGAGGATVSIATAPLAVQVLFIPTFFYDLCKVQKQNADDPNSCPQWREAVQGKLESVAGDYRYLVRWSDGVLRRGKLSFDMNDDGHTITLRKP